MSVVSAAFSIISTDKSSHPDGNSSHPTSFSEQRIMSADLRSCRSWQRSVFSSFVLKQLRLPLLFNDDGPPFVVLFVAATEVDNSVAVISLVCLSWQSLIDASISLRRVRSQSTVRLSTVSELGCSLLPNVSSLRV